MGDQIVFKIQVGQVWRARDCRTSTQYLIVDRWTHDGSVFWDAETVEPPHEFIVLSEDEVFDLWRIEKHTEPLNGVVYFIEAVGADAIKIGFTMGDPMKRLAALQTGNHARLQLLGAVPVEVLSEKRFHQWFRQYRIHGEWFRAVDAIRQAALAKDFMEVLTWGVKTVGI